MIPPIAWAFAAAAALLAAVRRSGSGATSTSAHDGIHVYQTPLGSTPPSTVVPGSGSSPAHTTPSHASRGTVAQPHAASAATAQVPADMSFSPSEGATHDAAYWAAHSASAPTHAVSGPDAVYPFDLESAPGRVTAVSGRNVTVQVTSGPLQGQQVAATALRDAWMPRGTPAIPAVGDVGNVWLFQDGLKAWLPQSLKNGSTGAVAPDSVHAYLAQNVSGLADSRLNVAQVTAPDGTWQGSIEIRPSNGRQPVRVTVQMPTSMLQAAAAAGRDLFAQALARASRGDQVEGFFDFLGGSNSARGGIAANPYAQVASTLFAGPAGPMLLGSAQDALSSQVSGFGGRTSPGDAGPIMGVYGMDLEYLPTVGLALSDPRVAASMLGEDRLSDSPPQQAPGPFGAPVAPQHVAMMVGPMLGSHLALQRALSATSRSGDSEIIVRLRAMLAALDQTAGQLLRSPDAADRLAAMLRTPLGFEAVNLVRALLGLSPTGQQPRDYSDSDEPAVSGADSIECMGLTAYYPRPSVGAKAMPIRRPTAKRPLPPAHRNAATPAKVAAARAKGAQVHTHLANAQKALAAVRNASAQNNPTAVHAALTAAKNAAHAARAAAQAAHTSAGVHGIDEQYVGATANSGTFGMGSDQNVAQLLQDVLDRANADADAAENQADMAQQISDAQDRTQAAQQSYRDAYGGSSDSSSDDYSSDDGSDDGSDDYGDESSGLEIEGLFDSLGTIVHSIVPTQLQPANVLGSLFGGGSPVAKVMAPLQTFMAPVKLARPAVYRRRRLGPGYGYQGQQGGQYQSPPPAPPYDDGSNADDNADYQGDSSDPLEFTGTDTHATPPSDAEVLDSYGDAGLT